VLPRSWLIVQFGVSGATREAQSACRAVKQRRRELGGAERADKSYSFICYNGERAMRATEEEGGREGRRIKTVGP